MWTTKDSKKKKNAKIDERCAFCQAYQLNEDDHAERARHCIEADNQNQCLINKNPPQISTEHTLIDN